MFDQKDRDRFWSKVKKDAPENCWVWAGTDRGNGYGVLKIKGKLYSAHRLMYVFNTGKEIPQKMFICHTCDNPNCVNPGHLFLGDRSDNMKDAYNKGRLPFIFNKKGEECSGAKLTEKEIHEIRNAYEYDNKSRKELSNIYKVTTGHIGKIIRKDVWSHI